MDGRLLPQRLRRPRRAGPPRRRHRAWRAPTSTIAPTIVLRDGRVHMVTGAPGAGRIPTEVAQTMLYVLGYGLDPLDALRMPRVFPSAGSAVMQVEHGFPPALLAEVRAHRLPARLQAANYARLYMIVRTPTAGSRWPTTRTTASRAAAERPHHDGEPQRACERPRHDGEPARIPSRTALRSPGSAGHRAGRNPARTDIWCLVRGGCARDLAHATPASHYCASRRTP
jgi:hypothetical protein